MAIAHPPGDNQQFAQQQGAGGGQTVPDWDDVKGGVGDMAEAAVERGRHFLDSAKEQATGYVDDRKNELAQTVLDLANSIRETGGALGERPNVRTLVDSAAGGLEQLAEAIRARSFADIMSDVEAAVRRRPGVAATATLAAGFLLARFIKASTEGARNTGQPSGQARGSEWQRESQSAGANIAGRGQTRV